MKNFSLFLWFQPVLDENPLGRVLFRVSSNARSTGFFEYLNLVESIISRLLWGLQSNLALSSIVYILSILSSSLGAEADRGTPSRNLP